MKELLPQTPEKTSRRGFTKTMATALVAAPVIASLSSCAQDKRVGEPATTPGPGPLPHKEDRGINPPVVIDGGSFTLIAPGSLRPGVTIINPVPKAYPFNFRRRNDNAFGPIKGIRIIDDYGFNVFPPVTLATDPLEYTLLNGEALQVYIWIARVKPETDDDDDDDDDTDTAKYHGITTDPNIVLQGGVLEVMMDKKIKKDRKLFKREGKNQKKYHINDWEGGLGPSSFRVAQVIVLVKKGTQTTVKYDSSAQGNENDVKNGFRIYLPVYDT